MCPHDVEENNRGNKNGKMERGEVARQRSNSHRNQVLPLCTHKITEKEIQTFFGFTFNHLRVLSRIWTGVLKIFHPFNHALDTTRQFSRRNIAPPLFWGLSGCPHPCHFKVVWGIAFVIPVGVIWGLCHKAGYSLSPEWFNHLQLRYRLLCYMVFTMVMTRHLKCVVFVFPKRKYITKNRA